jgi:hypothetical protein
MSSCCAKAPSLPLDLNGSTVVVGGAGKDHQVETRDIGLAAHQLTDWSDRINNGCPRWLVVKPCSGCKTPAPDDSLASASR